MGHFIHIHKRRYLREVGRFSFGFAFSFFLVCFFELRLMYYLRKVVNVASYSFFLRVDALEEVLAILPLQLLVVGRCGAASGLL